MILKESDLRRLVREVVRNKEKALEEEVQIVLGDVIPAEMLLKGDKDPEISGFVYLKEKDRLRMGIYYREELVGFATPREDHGGWRIGAIYVDEDVRRNVSGIGGIAIDKFFNDVVSLDDTVPCFDSKGNEVYRDEDSLHKDYKDELPNQEMSVGVFFYLGKFSDNSKLLKVLT